MWTRICPGGRTRARRLAGRWHKKGASGCDSGQCVNVVARAGEKNLEIRTLRAHHHGAVEGVAVFLRPAGPLRRRHGEKTEMRLDSTRRGGENLKQTHARSFVPPSFTFWVVFWTACDGETERERDEDGEGGRTKVVYGILSGGGLTDAFSEPIVVTSSSLVAGPGRSESGQGRPRLVDGG